MIAHVLTIVMNELNGHLADTSSKPGMAPTKAAFKNLAEGFAMSAGNGGVSRDMLYMSVVNIKEVQTLKNLPNHTRNDATIKATYENHPIFLNSLILLKATHTKYSNALTVLFKAIFFSRGICLPRITWPRIHGKRGRSNYFAVRNCNREEELH